MKKCNRKLIVPTPDCFGCSMRITVFSMAYDILNSSFPALRLLLQFNDFLHCLESLFNTELHGRELVYSSALDFKKNAPDILTLNMIMTLDLK